MTGLGEDEVERSIKELESSIYFCAGEEFNINSPKQLAEVLFTHLALPTKGLKKNKNGYSTDVDTLMSAFSTTSHTGNVTDAANINRE